MLSDAQVMQWLLVLACCGISIASLAQRTAVPPLTPRPPASQATSPLKKQAMISSDMTSVTINSAVTSASLDSLKVSAPEPLFLLSDELIIDGTMLSTINPQTIKAITIHKGAGAPQQWRSLTTYGIISITLKKEKKVKSQLFSDIARELGVSGPIQYTLNGMPVAADANLRIACESVAEVKVLPASPTTSGTTVAIRVRLSPPRTLRHDPPGTIYIRGATMR